MFNTLRVAFSIAALSLLGPLLAMGEPAQNYPHLTPLTYPAVLQPLQRTAIGTELTARVITIYKRMGESFNKGEALVQLDDEALCALVMKAEAGLERAQANYATKSALYAGEIASHNELIDAKAALISAKAELTLARINLDNATIIAPYDGRVLRVNVEEGEYANRVLRLDEKPLLDIANDKVMLAQILVSARYITQVRLGQTLKVHVQETGEEVQGIVSRIGAEIDPVSGTFVVEATIDNASGKLYGGMTGLAQISGINGDGR